MFLTCFDLNNSRLTSQWAANPYRVHQRLMMASDGDPRLLFRIEEWEGCPRILAQSRNRLDWRTAFANLPVLDGPPREREWTPLVKQDAAYQFRVLANPTRKITKDDGRKTRLGILREADQLAWITRKFTESGAIVEQYIIVPQGMQHSFMGDAKRQTHLAVMFNGLLRCYNPAALVRLLECGVGTGKGFGFGLLSLAPA